MSVKIEKPEKSEMEKQGVFRWPIWEKEVSRFDWHYDQTEQCYILEGEIEIITDNGSYEIKQGNFVTFEKGLSCEWVIKKNVRKHYHFL